MPLKDAEKFIKDIAKDTDIRTSLYQFETSLEMMKKIEEMGYFFKLYDFEESINHLKTESPTEEQGIMLEELLLWWNMIMFDGTITDVKPSCTPTKCSTCSSCG